MEIYPNTHKKTNQIECIMFAKAESGRNIYQTKESIKLTSKKTLLSKQKFFRKILEKNENLKLPYVSQKKQDK